MSLKIVVRKDQRKRIFVSFNSYYDRDVIVTGHTTFVLRAPDAEHLADALQKAIHADFSTTETEIEVIL